MLIIAMFNYLIDNSLCYKYEFNTAKIVVKSWNACKLLKKVFIGKWYVLLLHQIVWKHVKKKSKSLLWQTIKIWKIIKNANSSYYSDYIKAFTQETFTMLQINWKSMNYYVKELIGNNRQNWTWLYCLKKLCNL